MSELAAEKAMVWAHLEGLSHGEDVARIFASNARAHVAHPYGTLNGPEQIATFYADLRRALPDATWRCDFLVGGDNHPDPRMNAPRVSPQVAAMGHWQGTFTRPLLGIAPTGGVVHMRICEVHHLNPEGQIARSWILPDFLDLLRVELIRVAAEHRHGVRDDLCTDVARHDHGALHVRCVDAQVRDERLREALHRELRGAVGRVR